METGFSSNRPPGNGTRPDKSEGREGLLKRLRKGLAKTRSEFTGRLDRLLLGKKEITEELLEELEEILFTADIGVRATQELIDAVEEMVARKELKDPEKVKETLRDLILAFMEIDPVEGPGPGPGEPLVIMVIGVNGVGKTTTIGKAAKMFRDQGKEVLLIAGDTFRAAAIEQLSIWADRVQAHVVKQRTGADPSAVVFDGLSSALSGNANVVLIDTAGRLHTRGNLMEELRKIRRVVDGKIPGAPHEVWLVLDATTGQNAVSQAETFHEAIGVTGIVLTKLDGTAKGGIVAGISHQLHIPVKFIGVGEKVEDLRPFEPEAFVEAIFE